MAVWYLDNDDEITDAVARLRGASDERVVFVVPPGSRIATGRINFKLLAREARSRDVQMAVASSDQQIRALAASAGVLVANTADAAEAALERGDEPPPERSLDPTPDQDAAGISEPAAATTGVLFGWDGRRLAATTAIVLVVALIGVYAAFQTLPTARITLMPRAEALGPLTVNVSAEPGVAEPDVEAGRIPATVIKIPLTIERSFEATGVETVDTAASGEVLFSSRDTFQDIAAGTRVMTPSGVEFRTTELVTLGAPTGSQTEGVVAAPVIAVEAGADGNVAAASITVVPSLEDQGISVTNPEPTSGGRREETPRVSAADYDAAAADIQNRLAGALAAWLRDPANAPEGLTLYPETAQAGQISHLPSAEDMVGTGTPEFTLTGALDAAVLAVDEQMVDELARRRLQAGVPDGMALLDESVSVETGKGSAQGQRIGFSSVVDGEVFRRVDREAVEAQVAGLPISEAQAILEPLGETTVTVWPEFLSDLPGDISRITLDVREPSTTE